MLSPVPAYWYETHAHFSPRVTFYLWHGLASSTQKSYSTSQKSYNDFVRLRPNLLESPGQYLPATSFAILEWIASLGDRALQPKTIKSYRASLRSLHVDAGLPFENCESPTVQRLIRGIKRFYEEQSRQPKLPITLSILQQLVGLSGDCSIISNAIIDAAEKVAWAGFLRCEEFTIGDKDKFDPAVHLTRACVDFLPSFANPTHVRLTLPASKTDPFRKGVTILIAAVPGQPTCAVAALKQLFTIYPLSPSAPLFADANGNPLTCSHFISTLKSRLATLGFDSSLYSGHSFRRGAATSAASAGYSDYELQLLGQWRSDAYKLYIDIPRDRVLHLSARLHVAAAPAQPFKPPSLPFAPRLA